MNHSEIRHVVLLIVALLSPLLAVPSRAVNPGVDIAAPRVITSVVSSALVFVPRNPVVERGDYIRWQNIGLGIHTSTSGPACLVTDGLWDFPLGPGVLTPARQFNEAPGGILYHCTPHCGLGMTGTVTVTGLIDLRAADSGTVLTLSWSGGSGRYHVVRSDNSLFAGANTQTFLPDGGIDTGTTFTDAVAQPVAGKAFFYLVMNRTLG